jgi:GNAT superfamily N-acetyltransferase
VAAPAGNYALVPATSIDEARLIDFARAVWPKQAPDFPILTSWWRRAAPECAVAVVHQPSGAMAGICGGRPCEWTIDGMTVPAIGICDWFVAPPHEGKGLGRRLVRHFDAPDRFFYAFSISDAAKAYLKALGWDDPHSSSLMVLPLPRFARVFFSAPDGLVFQERDLGYGEPLGDLGAVLDAIETARGFMTSAHMRRGAKDWAWRLSVCGKRRYRLWLARDADGRPLGYVVVRPMLPGRSRTMDRLKAAMITDLVALDDDPAVLRALVGKAVRTAAALQARILLMATTSSAHARALAGFLSPVTPLIGRLLARRAPQFMWRPKGVAAKLQADHMTLTFADVALDLDL